MSSTDRRVTSTAQFALQCAFDDRQETFVRTLVAIMGLMVAACVHGAALADTRSVCVAACEKIAQPCLTMAHGTYDACKPAAHKTCSPKQPSEKFTCLTGIMRACTKNHSAESGACRTAFEACYGACGAHPPEIAEFWCTLDADDTETNGKVRKEALCSGVRGLSPAEQLTHCIKQYTPADPTVSYSLECAPLG